MIYKRFFIIKIAIIFLLLILNGCSILEPKLPPEKIISETEEVIEIVRTQPDWLRENDLCPKDLLPNEEKEVFYLDEGCENKPKKCWENCKNEDANACYSLARLIKEEINMEQGSTSTFLSSL